MIGQAKIAFGLRDEEVVHVLDVDNGDSCRCKCLKCAQPLRANQGTKKVAYFSHQPGLSDCGITSETALHKAIIYILTKTKSIFLPELSVQVVGSDLDGTVYESETISVVSNDIFKSDDAKSEVIFAGDRRADVIFYKDKHQLAVEVAVTHPLDEKKCKDIVQYEFSTIEIDASSLDRSMKIEEITKWLNTKGCPIKWIYNHKAEKVRNRLSVELDDAIEIHNKKIKLRREAEKRVLKKKNEAETRKQLNIEAARIKLRQPIQDILDELSSQTYYDKRTKQFKRQLDTHPVWKGIINQMLQAEKHLDKVFWSESIKNDWVFECDPKVWKAGVFLGFVNQKTKSNEKVDIKSLDVANWCIKEFGLSSGIKELRDYRQNFKNTKNKECWFLTSDELELVKSPCKVVFKYLKKLSQHRFLSYKRDVELFGVNNFSSNNHKNSVIKKNKHKDQRKFDLDKWRSDLRKEKEEIKEIREARNEDFYKRIELRIKAEKYIHNNLSGEGIECRACFMVSPNNKEGDKKCQYCAGGKTQAIFISEDHLKVAKYKYRSEPIVWGSLDILSNSHIEKVLAKINEVEDK